MTSFVCKIMGTHLHEHYVDGEVMKYDESLMENFNELSSNFDQ